MNTIKSQTKLESAIESVINIAFGFIISLLVWIWFVVPVYDLPVSYVDNLEITLIFTVVSVVRSYCIRRLGDWKQRRKYNENRINL